MVEFDALKQEYEALLPLPASDPQLLSAYLKTSANWINTARHHLPLIAALADQPVTQQSPLTHIWMRHTALYLLLGLRNKVNHHTLQHGIAALLGYYRLDPAARGGKVILNIRQQLLRNDLSYWAEKTCPPSLTRSRFTDCFDTAWYCKAILVKRPSLSIVELISLVANKLPLPAYQHLSNVAHYPGILGEGSLVSHQQQRALIVGQLPDSVLLYYVAEGHFAQVNKLNVTPIQTEKRSVRQWLEISSQLQQQPEEGEIFTLPAHAWALPDSYPIGKPPASLQTLLRALNDPDVPTQKVVALVSKEPAFSDFLNSAASKDNRMQLPVDNVKQSILTYGLERVGNMLVQHALYQRLTQHQFPMSDWFSIFAQIAITVSSELASISGQMTPQNAGLATTIVISPLFTLAPLKCSTLLPHNTERLFDITSLISPHCSGLSEVRQLLQTLSSAWQQERSFSQLFAYIGKFPNDVPSAIRSKLCIIGLSLTWTRQWLFTHSPCEPTEEFLRQVKQAFPKLLEQEQALRDRCSHLQWCPIR